MKTEKYMNPRIKTGWDYFWNLKPSDTTRMKNMALITQLHTWMALVQEEFSGPPKEKDLETMTKEIFKT